MPEQATSQLNNDFTNQNQVPNEATGQTVTASTVNVVNAKGTRKPKKQKQASSDEDDEQEELQIGQR